MGTSDYRLALVTTPQTQKVGLQTTIFVGKFHLISHVSFGRGAQSTTVGSIFSS